MKLGAYVDWRQVREEWGDIHTNLLQPEAKWFAQESWTGSIINSIKLIWNDRNVQMIYDLTDMKKYVESGGDRPVTKSHLSCFIFWNQKKYKFYGDKKWIPCERVCIEVCIHHYLAFNELS